MLTAKPSKRCVMSFQIVTDTDEVFALSDGSPSNPNLDWLKANASEFISAYRSQYVCIANQVVFASSISGDAWKTAHSTYPDDHCILALFVALPQRCPIGQSSTTNSVKLRHRSIYNTNGIKRLGP
jgi:hypothetical protein